VFAATGGFEITFLIGNVFASGNVFAIGNVLAIGIVFTLPCELEDSEC
jgi:hypothetical protein